MLLAIAVVCLAGQVIDVSDSQALTRALQSAKPGTIIRLAPGTYKGGVFVSGVQGTKQAPITVRSRVEDQPAKFVGGGTGLQVSRASHLVIDNLVVSGCTANGVNIDDGGSGGPASTGIVVSRVVVADLPPGNHDGIKLSGLDGFEVRGCNVSRWGGSGIDMVGCRNGVIRECTFQDGGDSGIQMKGGTESVKVEKCTFKNFGQRGINSGGSTGLEFFRPALASWPADKWEARSLKVVDSTFSGGMAAMAFVGSVNCEFNRNVIYLPGKWAFRILQENRSPGFVPCQSGSVSRNIIVWDSRRWGEGGTNIGSGTRPESFAFSGNFWSCTDNPGASRPKLPVAETSGVYGQDPGFVDASRGDFRLKAGSAAVGFGPSGAEARR